MTRNRDKGIAIINDLTRTDIVGMDRGVSCAESDLELFLRLSPLQQRGLMLYISGKNIREICRELEIAESTFYIWLGSELFEKCLKSWQKKIRIEADNKIRLLGFKALDHLENMLDNCQDEKNKIEILKLIINLVYGTGKK